MFNSSIAVCVHRDDVTEQWREYSEKEVKRIPLLQIVDMCRSPLQSFVVRA